MDWKVELAVKDSIRDWSNQIVETKYKDTKIDINIDDLICKIHLQGEDVEEAFYLVWELLFLYDGYFYEPNFFCENDVTRNPKDLIRISLYSTDSKWYSSALLGRNNRDLSENVIKQYSLFRNEGKSNHKMSKTLVNAFYYLHSSAYGQIIASHMLSLMLNIGDGFVNNVIKKTKSVKGSIDILFKRTIDRDRVKKGISLLGISSDEFTYNLAEERNEFDHYIYKDGSLFSYIANSSENKSKFITWYFIYTVELVIRICFLKNVGIEIEQEIKDYAMDQIVDWVIYENDLPEECSTPIYQIMQLERKIEQGKL